MDNLHHTIAAILDELETKNAVRDATLARSRTLIRHCANSIRAVHRGEFADAEDLLQAARDVAAEMVRDLAAYPDIYFAGYTQDALKELAEAHITYAIIANKPVPTPRELAVEPAAYLNGIGEAAGELRRFVLDCIRRGQVAEGERALEAMDVIYSHLATVDYPDAITGGLRRTTDMVRGVLERTRGDFTTAVRQDQLQEALRDLERKLGR
jgi:translin